MGPRLASLALLLLALCRQSSAGISIKIESLTGVATTSLVSADKKDEVTTTSVKAQGSTSNQDADKIKLINMLGNTIVLLVFAKTNTLKDLPVTLKKSILHGVVCEFENTTALAAEIRNLPGYTRDSEEQAVALHPDINIVCGTEPSEPKAKAFYDCFCGTARNPLLVCIGEGFKTEFTSDAAGEFKTTPGNCRKQAVAALVASGTTELGKLYDLDSFGSDSFSAELGSGDVDAITKNEDAKIAKIYCDATDDNVKNAVKAVYAADFAYWLAESVILTALGGEPGKGLAQYCAEDEFKNSPYGKCVCTMDTGFTFCIFNAIGGILKEKGYLSCVAGQEKFVPEKKPTEPVKIKPAAQSGGGATTPSSKPSDSAAATSSLLLAPLAAAAVLLAH